MPRKDKPGYRVPESRLQAQWPLQTPWGGLSTGARTPEGLQRISEANLKHGRQTKDKLEANRHTAKVGRRVHGELKQLELQLEEAGLMPYNLGL